MDIDLLPAPAQSDGRREIRWFGEKTLTGGDATRTITVAPDGGMEPLETRDIQLAAPTASARRRPRQSQLADRRAGTAVRASTVAAVRSHALSVVSAAVACVALAAMGGSAAAKAPCRTFVVHEAPKSIVLHKCDRVRIQLHGGEQADPPYFWSLSHKPNRKVLKLIHGGYWHTSPPSDEPDQYWTYLARAKGHTSMTFGFYTPSYPNSPPSERFKLSVTVR
jgi:hypothetical protein